MPRLGPLLDICTDEAKVRCVASAGCGWAEDLRGKHGYITGDQLTQEGREPIKSKAVVEKSLNRCDS